ncbi:MAG: neutral zinc metallopeptidase [Burkholderiales bacterium]
MRLDDERSSDNIEDRRGMGPRGGGLSRGVKGGGIGIVVLALVAMFFGVDPAIVMQGVQQLDQSQQSPQQQAGAPAAAHDEMREFIGKILGSTETTWIQLFKANGRQYPEPTLVLFSGAVQSACGFAQAAAGPFYCGSDRKVYIDLSFYRDLKERFKAPGDFAQAYVIAHEVGHHVQNVLGIMEKVQAAQQRSNERDANALSVRLELQADCFAGIWAHHANRDRGILEQGDVEEGLNAATQIGDDRIMLRSKGYVVPEGFTHGSGEQRVRWFRRGLESGDTRQCDTFGTRQL